MSFSYGVFFLPQSYPQFYAKPDWDTFTIPEKLETNVDVFVQKCCKILRLVTNLIISMKDTHGFSASPYPRLPQRKIFEDPEFLFPPGKAAIESEAMTDSPTATMHFCSFLPEGALQTLKSRGCTYFLQPSKFMN